MSGTDSPRTTFRVPKYVRPHFWASIGISCLLILITTIAFFQLQPLIPLFYSLAEPNEYLADKYWIFVFPVISACITVGHLLLLPMLRNHDRVIQQLFSWLTVLVQVLCVVAALRVILIVW